MFFKDEFARYGPTLKLKKSVGTTPRDITGLQYGRLTVLGPAARIKGRLYWYCRCACGIEIQVLGTNLKSGDATSCGCSRIHDLTGQVFGRLTVLRYAGPDKWSKALFLCRCTCGTEKLIPGRNLKLGQTKSCGCLKREKKCSKLNYTKSSCSLTRMPTASA